MKEITSIIVTWLALAPLVATAGSGADRPGAPAPGEARWTRGFWADRFSLAENVMAPFLWEYMQGHADTIGISGLGRSFAWNNLQIAAGIRKGAFEGRAWSDGDFYKWLESLAHLYAVDRDARLDALMDQVIAVIGQAQQPDGYINTQITIPGKKRFAAPENHEMYNLGHLMLAGAAHYRATGKRTLLDIARRAGDCLHAEFASPRRHFPGYTSIMGLVELYRASGDRKYLDLAVEFVSKQGAEPGMLEKYQDRTPLRKETRALGHAVWGTYLYSGAADTFIETADKTVLAALERIWQDLYSTKTYITGSVSAAHHIRTPASAVVAEAFGKEYRLPSGAASNETCSHIGAAMWNLRMLRATGEARYADRIEQVIYNSLLASMGVEGKTFFYTNPLRRHGAEGVFLEDDTLTRWSHRVGNCCPPNILRTLASLQEWAYGIGASDIWVNLYGASLLESSLGGTPVKIEQQTDYPWDGNIRLRVDVAKPARFGLRLRIPAWTDKAALRVNGAALEARPEASGYLRLERTWSAGDVVELALPMEPRLMEANPLVEELGAQVAVQRGPMVYCLESPDLPGGVQVSEVALPLNAALTPRFDRNLLGGVVVLEGAGVAFRQGDWSGLLYRALQPGTPREIPVRLIPYYAWANRGISHMTVWLPVAARR